MINTPKPGDVFIIKVDSPYAVQCFSKIIIVSINHTYNNSVEFMCMHGDHRQQYVDTVFLFHYWRLA